MDHVRGGRRGAMDHVRGGRRGGVRQRATRHVEAAQLAGALGASSAVEHVGRTISCRVDFIAVSHGFPADC